MSDPDRILLMRELIDLVEKCPFGWYSDKLLFPRWFNQKDYVSWLRKVKHLSGQYQEEIEDWKHKT